MFFAKIHDEITFHVVNKFPINSKNLRYLRYILDNLIIALDRVGWDHLDTWIPIESKNEIKFAEFFGFRPTGFDKILYMADGSEIRTAELRLKFPEKS